MSRFRFRIVAGLVGVACLFAPFVQSQPAANKAKPMLEPVAETKLLMEGLAASNMRGLGKLLREKPADAEAWGFARGQALLLAETGNLLLMRPPRTAAGQDAWLTHSADLREAAGNVARAAAAKDYAKSRTALASVANACNRCHQVFRVPARIDPFAEE